MERWSKEEIRLVMGNTPTKELAKIMNRSVDAINHKRLKLGVTLRERIYAPPVYSETEKRSRIYALASKLGVRLFESEDRA